ncbi:hypothetical protein EW026_g2288 [Hermanssonia centrifuga]|uniref:Uncharacterized protein n=1 Tax=Hermanssonia centrifuga TaxID=98765 RepID=A0A4S4KQR5_9APHY|nr:hypothetical protein EW026_g2288 [Hermanssonia centrifuga]
MSLMNSLWNLLDWFLPSIRLSDDLDDPEAQPNEAFSLRRRSLLNPPRLRSHSQIQAPDLEWQRQREREQRKEQERDKDRQRIGTLERENAALTARISQLEHDLRTANQSLSTLRLLSSPALPLDISIPPPPSPPLDPASLHTAYEALIATQALTHRALHDRTEEVSSLRTFLSKTDDWSGAQLLQALRDLNAEIVQLAASVVDEFSSALDRKVDLTRPSDRDVVHRALGAQMEELLERRDHAADPTLLQFAIQALLVAGVRQIMDAFCFGVPREVDNALISIFEGMHRLEPQPTTARWRALTHAHLRTMLPNGNIPLTPVTPTTSPPANATPLQVFTENSLRGVLAVLVLAGCTDSKGVRRDPLRARFGSSLSTVGERAIEIAGAIREGVMSAAFEVIAVSSAGGQQGLEEALKFEASTMDNVFAGLGVESGTVLCTVEFGLACVRKVGDVGGSASQVEGLATSMQRQSLQPPATLGGHGTKIKTTGINTNVEGVLDRSLLMKPKVLLDSFTQIL